MPIFILLHTVPNHQTPRPVQVACNAGHIVRMVASEYSTHVSFVDRDAGDFSELIPAILALIAKAEAKAKAGAL